ncbi:MAG: phospholipase A [Bacteriovoracaceae bacterium]|nr:phospholipase A [Bacteriovoracaceae bacterium]
MPIYVVGGDEDLKLQFSSKYRLAQNLNIYLAYTQTMFWSIYEASKPFKDITYAPEIFYRFWDRENVFLKSIDAGYLHNSNGKKEKDSRSFDRFFLKFNQASTIGRNVLYSELRIYQLANKDPENTNIDKYFGFWDLQLRLTNLITFSNKSVDLELKIFAGSKIVDFDQGGKILGIIYRLGSKNFNPALYLQYYSGYAESLLTYQEKSEELRFGIILSAL